MTFRHSGLTTAEYLKYKEYCEKKGKEPLSPEDVANCARKLIEAYLSGEEYDMYWINTQEELKCALFNPEEAKRIEAKDIINEYNKTTVDTTGTTEGYCLYRKLCIINGKPFLKPEDAANYARKLIEAYLSGEEYDMHWINTQKELRLAILNPEEAKRTIKNHNQKIYLLQRMGRY